MKQKKKEKLIKRIKNNKKEILHRHPHKMMGNKKINWQISYFKRN